MNRGEAVENRTIALIGGVQKAVLDEIRRNYTIDEVYSSTFRTKEDVLKINKSNVLDHLRNGLDPNHITRNELMLFMQVSNQEIFDILEYFDADTDLIDYSHSFAVKGEDVSDFLIERYTEFLLSVPNYGFNNTKSEKMLQFLIANHRDFNAYFDNTVDTFHYCVWDALLHPHERTNFNLVLNELKNSFNREVKCNEKDSTNQLVKLGFIYVFRYLYDCQSLNTPDEIKGRKVKLDEFLNLIEPYFSIQSKTSEGKNIFFMLEKTPPIKVQIAEIFMTYGIDPFEGDHIGSSFYDMMKSYPKRNKEIIDYLESTEQYKIHKQKAFQTPSEDSQPVVSKVAEALEVVLTSEDIPPMSRQAVYDEINAILAKNDVLDELDCEEQLEPIRSGAGLLEDYVHDLLFYLHTGLDSNQFREVSREIAGFVLRPEVRTKPDSLLTELDPEINEQLSQLAQKISQEVYSSPNYIEENRLFDHYDFSTIMDIKKLKYPYRLIAAKHHPNSFVVKTDNPIFSNGYIYREYNYKVNSEAFMNHLRIGDIVYYYRDKSNTYYPNAVMVTNAEGFVLGYLPSHDGRKIAKTVAELLDQERCVYGRITKIGDFQQNIYLAESKSSNREFRVIDFKGSPEAGDPAKRLELIIKTYMIGKCIQANTLKIPEFSMLLSSPPVQYFEKQNNAKLNADQLAQLSSLLTKLKNDIKKYILTDNNAYLELITLLKKKIA